MHFDRSNNLFTYKNVMCSAKYPANNNAALAILCNRMKSFKKFRIINLFFFCEITLLRYLILLLSFKICRIILLVYKNIKSTGK